MTVVDAARRSELRRTAMAATQGEWRAEKHRDFPYDPGYQVYLPPADGGAFGTSGTVGWADTPADAAHIAAADPPTVLALLDQADAVQKLAGHFAATPDAMYSGEHVAAVFRAALKGREFIGAGRIAEVAAAVRRIGDADPADYTITEVRK